MVDNNNKYIQLAMGAILGAMIASLGYGITGIILMIFPYFFMGRSIQYGIIPAMVSMMASAGIVALLYNPMAGASVFLVFAPMVLIFHYCITSKRSYQMTFVAMAVVLAATMVIMSMALSGGISTTPEEMVQEITDLQREVLTDYTDLELSRMEDNLRTTLEFVQNASPAITIIGVLIVVYINYTMTGRSLFGRRILISQPPPLPMLQIPRWTLIVAAAVLGLGALATQQGLDPKGLIILNGMLVFGFLYLVNGLATVNLYMLTWGVPRMLRVLLYGMIFWVPAINGAAMVLGVIDSVVGLRRRADG